ncbi:MAG: penicillin acylase family protein [Saprospiraceae bacterium]|nr:penicillin acylase family protein [Saprospiraceae bacterium]
MNKLIVAGLSGIMLAGYLILLLTPLQLGENSLPPLGNFFNPFSGFWQNAEGEKPYRESIVHQVGIRDTVEVIYDDRLVPHIFAKNDLDLAFVEGYVHAQNRLWQMDLSARNAGGRLSEIFGARTLKNDRMMRRMGLTTAAEHLVELWKECPSYPFLQSYVAGINSYITEITDKSKPLECKLFDYDIEPWSDLKTALVTMSMNLVLCSKAWDMQASKARSDLGDEVYHSLFPDWDPKQSPVIPSSAQWDFVAELGPKPEDTLSLGHIDEPYESLFPSFVGSNNWAVSGLKTENGNPILCSDPHLNLTLPSIWYEMQVQTDELNAYGVSIPGIPHITIGFNEKIAWGMTNVGQDVLDFYRILWADSSRENYLLDGRILSTEKRPECFEVKGGRTICDTIAYTYWGPIYSEAESALALHWLPNEHLTDCAINTFLNLSAGTGFTDYWDALRSFESPPQNFVFASTTGDIALKVQGRFPIRQKNQGKFVQDGGSSKNGWRGFIPYEQTPFVKNPERGFVSSANQHSTDSTYPYPYHGDFQHYRSRTLNTALNEMEEIGVQDMMELQNSTYNQMAADLLPLLMMYVDRKNLDQKQKEAMLQLEKWNFDFDGGSPLPILFEKWRKALYDLVWDEMRTNDEVDDYYRPRVWRTIKFIEDDPEHKYFDLINTPVVETARDLVNMAFQEAFAAYDSLSDTDKDVTWQSYKNVRILHLSRIPAFSVDGISIGGSGSTLNAVTTTHGPSWRMVVELADPVQAWGIYPGGQSGNPGSRYYAQMIEDWRNGEYYPLRFAKRIQALSDASIHQITFSP